MDCPACMKTAKGKLGKLRVNRTNDQGMTVERDRVCPVCKHTFVTVELDREELKSLKAELNRLRTEARGIVLKELREKSGLYDSGAY